MDLRIVLDRLGHYDGLAADPCTDFSSYNAMVSSWRNTTKSPPTEAEVLAEWDVYLAEQSSTQHIRDRENAMHELLPESMYMPAMLEQARADREGGKTLEPSLDEAVNIYDQIMVDNPEPSP